MYDSDFLARNLIVRSAWNLQILGSSEWIADGLNFGDRYVFSRCLVDIGDNCRGMRYQCCVFVDSSRHVSLEDRGLGICVSLNTALLSLCFGYLNMISKPS